jgi:hypothetical protein
MLNKLSPSHIKNKLASKRLFGKSQQDLFKIALSDSSDAATRQAAIALIETPQMTELLYTQLSSEADKNIAANHWAKLLIYQEDIPAYMAEQCVLGCENQDLLLALLLLNDHASLSTLAFTGLSNDTHLLKLISAAPTSKIASAAIYKLNSVAGLENAKQYCASLPALLKKIDHRIDELTAK